MKTSAAKKLQVYNLELHPSNRPIHAVNWRIDRVDEVRLVRLSSIIELASPINRITC